MNFETLLVLVVTVVVRLVVAAEDVVVLLLVVTASVVELLATLTVVASWMRLDSMSGATVVVEGWSWKAERTHESPSWRKGALHWHRPNRLGMRKSQ